MTRTDIRETAKVLKHTARNKPAWIPFKLCETQHYLHWSEAWYFKNRPYPSLAEGSSKEDVGSLRYTAAPYMTELEIRQTREKENRAGLFLKRFFYFCLTY